MPNVVLSGEFGVDRAPHHQDRALDPGGVRARILGHVCQPLRNAHRVVFHFVATVDPVHVVVEAMVE
jgi:hypothetical protein